MTVMDELLTMVSVWGAEGRDEFATQAFLTGSAPPGKESAVARGAHVLRPGPGGLDESHIATAIAGSGSVVEQVRDPGKSDQGRTYRVESRPTFGTGAA